MSDHSQRHVLLLAATFAVAAGGLLMLSLHNEPVSGEQPNAEQNRPSPFATMRSSHHQSAEEIAESLHVSVETVQRDWKMAKLWLLRELSAKESL